jgi:hypothetical protein
MSENKLKYFTVNTTTLVKANNKSEAEKIAASNRRKLQGVDGEALVKQIEVDRISAAEAKQMAV